MNASIGEVMRSLRAERIRQKKKAKDVSFALGIHAASLCRLEKGTNEKMRYDFVQKYADVLGLRLELFMDVVKREDEI